jgi:RNA ligase
MSHPYDYVDDLVDAMALEQAAHEKEFGLPTPEFQAFPRMPRLNREIIITEKIDGTNAQIFIDETGRNMMVGSRNRWLTAGADNFGFCKWVNEHFEELLRLGPGRHFGEWWGAGIQRGYGLKEKRFSLFNVSRWDEDIFISGEAENAARAEPNPSMMWFPPPACCSVVPVMYRGLFSETAINSTLVDLLADGSAAAEGFDNPEGIVIYHTAAKQCFKRTFEHDETGKPE